MATYHLTAKIGQKGKAQPHAEYIAREGKYSESNRYEDLEAKASGNMPAWAVHNTAEFWKAADENERANGSTYREIEVALPRELTPPQRLELVQEFIKQEIGEKHAYQFAIHTPKAALEKGEQPHAHIMYSERIRDGIERDPEQYFKRHNAKNPEKGGAKKFSGGKSTNELKAELLELRERWANLQNSHLEKHGHSERVDHRSLKEQGAEHEPEKHLGGAGVRDNAKKRDLLELRAINAENAQAQAEAAQVIDLHKKQGDVRESSAAIADRFKQQLLAEKIRKTNEQREAREDAERKEWALEKAKMIRDIEQRQKAAADAEAQQKEQARIAQENTQKLERERLERERLEAAKPAPAPVQQKKPKSKDNEMEL